MAEPSELLSESAPASSSTLGRGGELNDHSLRNQTQSKAKSHTSTHAVDLSGATQAHTQSLSAAPRHRHRAS